MRRLSVAIVVTVVLGIGMYIALPKEPDSIEYKMKNLDIVKILYQRYLEAHQDSILPATDDTDFQHALQEYAPPNEDIKRYFFDDKTGSPFHVNTWLNGKKADETTARLVIVYETEPIRFSKGSTYRTYICVDGTMHFIKQEDWPTLARKSHLPEN